MCTSGKERLAFGIIGLVKINQTEKLNFYNGNIYYVKREGKSERRMEIQ
jgi:hypothetical protein